MGNKERYSFTNRQYPNDRWKPIEISMIKVEHLFVSFVYYYYTVNFNNSTKWPSQTTKVWMLSAFSFQHSHNKTAQRIVCVASSALPEWSDHVSESFSRC